MSSFEMPYDGRTITIKPLEEEYADFQCTMSWQERLEAQLDNNFTPAEYSVGRKKVTKEEDLIKWATQDFGPLQILDVRLGIMNALVAHTKGPLGVHKPAFSGRGGNRTLYQGKPFHTPEDGRIWATIPRVWADCIGESMNNPFKYMLTRQRDYQPTENGRNESFSPMITAFDVDMLEPALGNLVDYTSWKPKTGQTILGSVACLYYFNPNDLKLPQK